MIERNAQGLFDQDVSRLKYLTLLRSEHRRSGRRPDAEHVKVKSEMLQLRLMEKRRQVCLQSDVNDLDHRIAGITFTALSSMPACAPPGDLVTRRKIETCVFQVRKQLAAIAVEMADKEGEPPLSGNRADGSAASACSRVF